MRYLIFYRRINPPLRVALIVSLIIAVLMAFTWVMDLGKNKGDAPVLGTDSLPELPFVLSVNASAYGITSSRNPYFTEAVIDPLDVKVGDTQKMVVRVKDDVGVQMVTAAIEQDHGEKLLPLKLVGDNKDGYWYGEWKVEDTHSRIYHTVFTAENSKGEKNSITLAWSDPCAVTIVSSTSTLLNSDCAVSGVDGVDNGVLNLNGHTLTVMGTSTYVWNPSKSIVINGSIVISGEGQLKKTYLWALDSDNDGYWPTGTELVAQDTSPDAGVADPTLVGHWKLDDGAGTSAADSSGNANTGTLRSGSTSCSNPPTAGCPTWSAGQLSNALSFDASNDYVRATTTTKLDLTSTKVTMMAWVKPNTLAGTLAPRVIHYRSANRSYVLAVTQTSIASPTAGNSVYAGFGAGEADGGVNAISAGVWSHIAAVFDGPLGTDSFKIYVNGVPVATSTAVNVAYGDYQATIGGRITSGSPGVVFNGLIDEVRIYNRVLTQPEIQALMNPPSPSGTYKRRYAATSSGDCYDTSPSVFPGQAGYFTVERGDGSFDYNCDGSATQFYNTNGVCSCVSGVCTASAAGIAGAIPACGAAGSKYYTENSGSYIGDCPSILVTQSCR